MPLPPTHDDAMKLGLILLSLLVLAATGAAGQDERGLAEENVDAQKSGAAATAQNLIEHGQLEDARTLLNRALVRPYSVDSVALLRSLAALYARKGDFIAEAATHHDILELTPQDRLAQRGRVFALVHIGAAQLAAHYADMNSAAFTASELRELRQAAAGKSIKRGELEARAGLGPQRFAATDRALAKNAEVLAAHAAANAPEGTAAQRAEFDRIVALKDRARMSEAVALYEDLKRRQAQLPAYALAAAAEAYLYQRQPEQARDLYLQALRLSKDANDREYPNRAWQIQLFDAYVDANDFGAARELIDRLVQEIPPLLNAGLRGVEVDNEFHAQARVNAARLRLYADEPARSEAMLHALLASAPFNGDARLAYGELLLARDQPRAARAQFGAVLVDDPANVDAAVGMADSAIVLSDLGSANRYVSVLAQNYPESRAVQRVQRELRAHQRPVLVVTSEFGRSPTGAGSRGNRDWSVDMTLHSAPINDHWRVFAHSFNASADFDDETATRKRIGVGADYRAPSFEASAELHQRQFALDDVGVSLNSAWMPNDQWRLGAQFDSRSNDVPLQASGAGIDAQALGVSVDYSQNESTKLSAHLARLRFSDGNRRTQGGAGWTQRWVSGSLYKLDTRLGAFASHNTLADAAYFNPRRDASLELNVINEWKPWQRYERSFKHRLELGVGGYRQQGFGTGQSTAVRYEHEWNWDALRTLKYGLARSRQPFDGVADTRTSFFIDLAWAL